MTVTKSRRVITQVCSCSCFSRQPATLDTLTVSPFSWSDPPASDVGSEAPMDQLYSTPPSTWTQWAASCCPQVLVKMSYMWLLLGWKHDFRCVLCVGCGNMKFTLSVFNLITEKSSLFLWVVHLRSAPLLLRLLIWLPTDRDANVQLWLFFPFSAYSDVGLCGRGTQSEEVSAGVPPTRTEPGGCFWVSRELWTSAISVLETHV